MGQKVNPIGIRLKINRTWDSVWYGEKKEYSRNIHEDLKIKKFIEKEKKSAGISRVSIERFPDRVNVNINAARPGVLIGKKGADIEDLKKRDDDVLLRDLKDVHVTAEEISEELKEIMNIINRKVKRR